MIISVKCPNCYQQVSRGNRYCTFCGYDLSRTAEYDVPTAGAPEAAEPKDADSAYDEGSTFCENGHEVSDPSLGFCPICGLPLSDVPAPKVRLPRIPAVEAPPAPSRPAPAPFRPMQVRKCSRCGYVCDDPGLDYCPECGLPLDFPAAADDSGWVCSCGEVNSSDTHFCSRCGKPKDEPVPRPEPEPPAADRDVPVPAGMKPPVEADLKVKAKYGN